jgi:hypothetical protein
MTDARRRTKITKTTTGLTGFVAINAGGTTRLSIRPGNEGEKMTEPTKEYWQAKAQLCKKVAMDQLLQADVPNAMKNLERMVYALSRVEGFNNERNN